MYNGGSHLVVKKLPLSRMYRIDCFHFLVLLMLSISMIFLILVELLLYSPKRPVVDFAVVFLWLMAVGTLICACLWADFVACKQTDNYNQLVRDFCLTFPHQLETQVDLITYCHVMPM